MSSRLLLVTLSLPLALSTANAQIAGRYETFTHRPNAKSWIVYDYADQKFYQPGWDSAGNGQNPDIFFTFAGSSSLDIFARSSSSAGSFTGNFVAAGIDAIGCDIYIQDIASFDYAEFFLYSATDGKYYLSELIAPTASGWDAAYASLSKDTWYVFQNNDYIPVPLTPAILANITEIGVTFHPKNVPASNGKLVALDTFTVYGVYDLPKLTTAVSGSMFQLSFPRRPGIAYSISTSPNLTSWSIMPGEGNLTGSTPHTMALPLTPAPRFFKVGIEDHLTRVPDVPLPE